MLVDPTGASTIVWQIRARGMALVMAGPDPG